MKALSIVLALLVPHFLLAQNSSLDDADEYFQDGEYATAKSIYLRHTGSLTPAQQNALATSFVLEIPQKPDYANALKWFEKSAGAGHTPAMLNLVDMYGAGLGVAKDTVTAFEWLKKAAGTGDANSMLALGNFYYLGRYTKKNETLATQWWKSSAEKGNENAAYWLGMLHAIRKDYASALTWYKKSGTLASIFHIANFYRKGLGVPENLEESEYYYYRALEKGPPSELRQAIEDSLASFTILDPSMLKEILDPILQSASRNYAGLMGTKMSRQPALLPIGIQSVGGSIQGDAMTGQLEYYRYTGEPFFQHPYIRLRNSPTNPAPEDRQLYVFSGIIHHGEKDEEIARMTFDTWADELRGTYKKFKFQEPTEKKVSGKWSFVSMKGEGTVNGKTLFVDLNQQCVHGLYFVEIVVKDRRYMRIN